jgi:CheY-like chemotaxis protein
MVWSRRGESVVDQQAFSELIGEALRHLYEPAHLQATPLARLLCDAKLVESPERLGRFLTAAIETLRPPGRAPHASPGWRQYHYLYRRYVEVAGHRLIADELGLSARQATREHEAGLQALGALLWNKYVAVRKESPLPADSPAPPALDAELIELAAREPAAPISLREVVEGALATVSRMCAGASIDVCCALGDDLPPVVASKLAVRHILLGVLVYLIQHAVAGSVLRIEAAERPGASDLVLSIEPGSANSRHVTNGSGRASDVELARRLASLQGIQLDIQVSARLAAVSLVLPTIRARTVLYVDDSPDMGRLFRQYVAGTGYGLIHVRTAERALELSRQSPPDVFVLDVLLPTEDGWQLLERLRAEPRTAGTPVIVCSILPEETLAASLGISEFLPKPISQPDLLATLARCCPLV